MPSRRQSEQSAQLAEAGESRGAVALTVAWMLTCTSTAVAMLVVVALWLISLAFPFPGPRPHPLLVVAGLLQFVALFTGLLCLLFTPLAYRVRRTSPPRPITIAAVLIGLAPIVTLLVRAFQ
ncbi:MAG TPA: hypothetical protein VFB80_22225 [Pirellulaceae bacterium]|nr:hypothetical protein [Pirellulaceae bacterium]